MMMCYKRDPCKYWDFSLNLFIFRLHFSWIYFSALRPLNPLLLTLMPNLEYSEPFSAVQQVLQRGLFPRPENIQIPTTSQNQPFVTKHFTTQKHKKPNLHLIFFVLLLFIQFLQFRLYTFCDVEMHMIGADKLFEGANVYPIKEVTYLANAFFFLQCLREVSPIPHPIAASFQHKQH